jgi:replicative DNA helicase
VNNIIPPQDREAEMAVVASMLLDPNMIPKVLECIRPEHRAFYDPCLQTMFDEAVALWDANTPIDLVVFKHHLRSKGLFDKIGGQDAIMEVVGSVPDARNAVYYAEIVRDMAHRRRLLHHGNVLMQDAADPTANIDALLSTYDNHLIAIAAERQQNSLMHVADTVFDSLKEVEDRASGVALGDIQFGYSMLDEMTGGAHRGELIVAAARPSMGKTAFGLCIADAVASAGHAVDFYSLEMLSRDIAVRHMCIRCGVDVHRVRSGTLSEDELANLHNAATEIAELPMHIDDSASMTMLELRAKCRQACKAHKTELIIVDYLQLIQGGGRQQGRQEEVASVSRGLKQLAKELDIPILVLAQLNRNPEGRNDKRPRMSDLRESGATEQDADVIMLLHREEYYLKNEIAKRPDDPEWDKIRGVAEIIIDKNRNGPTGVVRMFFEDTCARFNSARPSTADEMQVLIESQQTIPF